MSKKSYKIRCHSQYPSFSEELNERFVSQLLLIWIFAPKGGRTKKCVENLLLLIREIQNREIR